MATFNTIVLGIVIAAGGMAALVAVFLVVRAVWRGPNGADHDD